jgi:hypothetical protein
MPVHKQTLTILCYLAHTAASRHPDASSWLRLVSNSVWPCAILHASHNLFIQGFFTPLTGSRGNLTAYVIDEFGVAVPLIIVLFAVGFWLNRGRVPQLAGAATRSTAPH